MNVAAFDADVNADTCDVSVHIPVSDARPVSCAEQIWRVDFVLAPELQVAEHDLAAFDGERHDSLLVALATDPDLKIVQVNVGKRCGQGLFDSQACVEQELNQAPRSKRIPPFRLESQ